VEAYGGSIAAESTPGKGTRMTVELRSAWFPKALKTSKTTEQDPWNPRHLWSRITSLSPLSPVISLNDLSVSG